MSLNITKYFGPSTLIAAAFIGPGTVTTCTLAGVTSGYSLLWAMLFSIIATIILQEMSARLGYITKTGLGEAIRTHFEGSPLKVIAIFLVISAIGVGNAAYESGNIAGTELGARLVFGQFDYWPIVIAVIAIAALLIGKYKLVEQLLVFLVVLMSLCFLVTSFLIKPNFSEILMGLVPGRLTSDDLLLAVALIGTTVVPYNLFLHASTISKKWKTENELDQVRKENIVSIILGGLISILIIITAAASREYVGVVNNASDLAIQLEPVLGQYAKYAMGFGLLAAGLSSTLTAPMATGYAIKGILGWKTDESSKRYQAILVGVVLLGAIVASLKINLITIIKFAQITNAILLPIIAGFLLYICNQTGVLGKYTNSKTRNILGIIVILICIVLSLKTFAKVLF